MKQVHTIIKRLVGQFYHLGEDDSNKQGTVCLV